MSPSEARTEVRQAEIAKAGLGLLAVHGRRRVSLARYRDIF
jgi:hypothetical protein